jgi:hypothetical protein
LLDVSRGNLEIADLSVCVSGMLVCHSFLRNRLSAMQENLRLHHLRVQLPDVCYRGANSSPLVEWL